MIDLALATLKGQSIDEDDDLFKALDAVIFADQRVTLHEFALSALVRSQLLEPARPPRAKHTSFSDVRKEAVLLFSLVAWAGADEGDAGQAEADSAFTAGIKELGFS